MNAETRAWLINQLKGFILITFLSFILAAGTNIFRNDPLPWIEKRRLLKAGDRFPFVALPTAEIPRHLNYLGLPSDKEIVTIVDIQADLLVIEVINVFCFPCQTQSLVLNQVFEMIEERPDLKGKIKIIGVALGNTKAVLDGFVEDYQLAFPVISDPELRSEKIIGPGIHTPFSLFIRRDASGILGLVAGTHDEVIEDPQIWLNILTTLMKKGAGSVKLDEMFREKHG